MQRHDPLIKAVNDISVGHVECVRSELEESCLRGGSNKGAKALGSSEYRGVRCYNPLWNTCTSRGEKTYGGTLRCDILETAGHCRPCYR